MHHESGHLMQQFRGAEKDGDVVVVERRFELVEPLRLQQHRPRLVPGLERAQDHLRRFGDVEAAGRFGEAAGDDVGQPDVVAQLGTRGIVNRHDAHTRF